ncbi:MAG: Eco57I restriction-modification methylase domain-containing protein [Methanosphaera sp.]|nr:Eco57I restriction-modification methylase domain-containing protein [Methanosphaera sp.]
MWKWKFSYTGIQLLIKIPFKILLRIRKTAKKYNIHWKRWNCQINNTRKKENSIKQQYGVDIDTLAVEVTKLSLLLKVLEDQKKDKVEQQQKLFHERVLPNLKDNIKNGNSLIETDILEQQELTIGEIKKIKPFDWEKEYPEVFEQGGFDVVIGNPPYIRIQEFNEIISEYYKNRYNDVIQGNYDTYILFIKIGLNLLNQKGKFGNILPNKFFTANYGKKIRKILSKKSAVDKIINFKTNQIFETATTYTCLLFLSNESNKKFSYVSYNLGDNFRKLDKNIDKYDKKILEEDTWKINDKNTQKILDIISSKEWKFENITEKIFKGSSTGNDKFYLMDINSEDEKYYYGNSKLKTNIKIEKEIMKPFVNGKDIKQYEKPNIKLYLLYPYKKTSNQTIELISKKELKTDYPKAFEYIEEFKQELKKRKISLNNNDYYKFSAARNLAYYPNKKIMIPDLLVKNRIGLDFTSKIYHGPSIHSVIFKEEINEKYMITILGILNSHLFWFFIKNTSTAMQGNAYRLTPMYLNEFYFPNLKKFSVDDMNKEINKIIELNKTYKTCNTPTERKLIQQQITTTDKKINEIVYELYDLTEEEIKIIEENI